MSDSSSHIDFALDDTEQRVDAIMRIETLLGPHALERFRKVCFSFADEQRNMSVNQLRLVLQVEDHLDWLLRNDQPRLQLWRIDTRRNDALAISNQIADMWQALGVCLGRYALGSGEWLRTQEQETGLLPLTIAVALHCHVNEMRWRARGERPCDVPMRALHRLYDIAESRHIADQEVHPYEADVDFSITPKGQYVLMLLMADLLERDLPPVQRLVAQHWLNSWSQDVVLDSTYVPARHSMLVNLNSGEGIQRIADATEPTFRYLDIHAIAKRVEQTDADLANSNVEDEITREVTEATEADFADTLTWLEKLYHDRSAAFQATRERQVAAPDRFARVVVGWNHIQDFIEAATWDSKAGRGTFGAKYPSHRKLGAVGEILARSATDLPILDPHFEPGTEKRDNENFVLWRLRDSSAGGLGLSSSHAADADLSVGTLLLVAMEAENRWSLGRIVRKFKALDETDSRFGIQLMGQDAVPVRLTPRQPDEQVKNTLFNTVMGLFLCRPEQPDKQDLLLVSSSALGYTRRFELKTGAKRLPIRTALPLQSAGAWVLIQFEEDIVGQTGHSAAAD
ncbi:MAG: hypothetical protein ABI905_09525 [Betaproteobacteria bacterium]